MSNVTQVPLQPVKRGVIVWLWVGIIAALAIGGLLAWKGTGEVVAAKGDNDVFLAWNKGQPGVVETASGLQYQVLKPGDAAGNKPTDTDLALITYKGALRDGRVFDENQRPVPMPVGGSIKGFSEGLKLMSKGAQYRLWIKPELGYGSQSPDPTKLPANSLLVFDVTLVDFLPEAVVRQMQMQQMQQMQGAGPGGAPGAPGAPAGVAPKGN